MSQLHLDLPPDLLPDKNGLTERDYVVLRYLARVGDTTVDEYVTKHRLYVNSWAPTFTGLKQRGFIERRGDQRKTTHDDFAYVLVLTEFGREALSLEGT